MSVRGARYGRLYFQRTLVVIDTTGEQMSVRNRHPRCFPEVLALLGSAFQLLEQRCSLGVPAFAASELELELGRRRSHYPCRRPTRLRLEWRLPLGSESRGMNQPAAIPTRRQDDR